MDKDKLQYELDLLLADRALNSGYLDNTKCIDWAISLMERGLNFANIDILAGLDIDDSYAVEDYIKKVVVDLGLKDNKTSEELFQLYIIDVATLAINNKISPIKGLNIFRDIWDYGSEYDFSTKLLKPFSCLAESISLIGEYQLFYTNLTEENKEEAILNEMNLLLLRISKNISIGTEFMYCSVCNDFTAVKTIEKGLFFKSQKFVCDKCCSTDFMSWNDVLNQNKILQLITEK